MNPRDSLVGRQRDCFLRRFKTDERDGLLVVYLLQTQMLRPQRLIYNASRISFYSTVDISQTLSSPSASNPKVRGQDFWLLRFIGNSHSPRLKLIHLEREVTMRWDQSRHSVLSRHQSSKRGLDQEKP